jgi:hypothetical protein
MEPSRRTTVLFPPELHDRLTRLAERTGTSLGELVRRACEAQYRVTPESERKEAVRELAELRLPTGSVDTLKRQSVPDPERLLP